MASSSILLPRFCMHRHTVPFVPFSACRLLNVGHQCATCRTLAVHAPRRCHSASSHGEQLHRHTAKSSTAVHQFGVMMMMIGTIAGLAQGPNTSGAGNCVVSFSASVRSTRLETTSSHGCGLYRHTAADNIATRCGRISPHDTHYIGTRSRTISSHGVK